MSENNYLSALAKIREEFGKGNPLRMADCSGAKYQKTTKSDASLSSREQIGIFTLRYLNKDYYITFPDGQISFAECDNSPDFHISTDYSGNTILVSDQTLILMYLTQASGISPRGQWVNFLQLPEGSHHHGPFINDAINPLVKTFNGKKDLFLNVIKELGGSEARMGDYGGVINPFPKIPLAFLIWEGDDEFPPKGNILFDSSISMFLDTAGAYVLGINAARRMMAVADCIK
ncbi:MAG: DUF3786 domain-containing protein [Bacillota bacterium]